MPTHVNTRLSLLNAKVASHLLGKVNRACFFPVSLVCLLQSESFFACSLPGSKIEALFVLHSTPTSHVCSRPSHVLIPLVFVLLFSSWPNCILLCPENHQSSICKCLMMYTNANKSTDISELVFYPEGTKSARCTGCEWLDLTPFSCWEKIHRISWAAETNYLSLTQCSAQQTLSLIWW